MRIGLVWSSHHKGMVPGDVDSGTAFDTERWSITEGLEEPARMTLEVLLPDGVQALVSQRTPKDLDHG